jgi:hypothetical protein
MSWNFTHLGTRNAVAEKVKAESYIPEKLKLAIADIVTAPTQPNSPKAVLVRCSGHVDSYSGSCKLEIESANLVLDPPAENVATPAESPTPATS